jgi:hypothetical protein
MSTSDQARCYRPRVSAPTRRSRCYLAVPLSLLSLLACDDLSRFGGSYGGPAGEIVPGSFVRSCFPDKTQLELSFYPDLVLSPPASDRLNFITTSDGTFQATPLEPIAKLHYDHLNEFDFSGPQRLRNYMMHARPVSGPLAGRDAVVVISLLASFEVEVRIMARSADDAGPCQGPAPASDAGEPPAATGRREYFGLWRLKVK